PVDNQYVNWYAGEPNGYPCCNATGEHYAHILGPEGPFWRYDPSGFGKWNDFPDYQEHVNGYVIEFGGMPGDEVDVTTSTSLVLKVKNVPNSTITPNTATFDKKTDNQQDIAVTMTLNGNALTEISNGATPLVLGTDYTVDGTMVT